MILAANSEVDLARRRLSGELKSVLELRPLPAAAMRINQACLNHETAIPQLVEMIECEPGIACRILSLVNSPLYGFPREIDSLNQAVVVLGYKKLSELVTSIAAQQVFNMDSESRQAGVAIFDHSLACATAARVLFQRTHSKHDAGAAFLAGMLHDIGKLFFFDLAPVTYSQLQQSTSRPALIEEEMTLFGKTHADLGMHFALTSGLPVSIRSAIEQHHSSQSDQQSILAENTDLANSLVKTWGIGGNGESPANPVATAWMAAEEPATIEVVRESINGRFQILRSLFLG